MRVRLSPSVLHFYVEVAEWKETRKIIPSSCENVTRAGESPAFDTIFYWVGDVIDSIEVLQTSCEGLNPSRSTNFLFARVAQMAEAIVSKTIQVQVQILPRVFIFRRARVAQFGRGG